MRAVREGRVSEEAVDEAAGRVQRLIEKYSEGLPEAEPYTLDEHHHLARRIARETMVLLKNARGLLPLSGGRQVAFIGEFAMRPRYQGGGSSHINAYKVLGAVEAARSVQQVGYARGFDSARSDTDAALLAEAVALGPRERGLRALPRPAGAP